MLIFVIIAAAVNSRGMTDLPIAEPAGGRKVTDGSTSGTSTMATTLLIPQDGGQAEKGGIVDDFMYGSNVAASHIYIRMGE